jgi:hypothetical protein
MYFALSIAVQAGRGLAFPWFPVGGGPGSSQRLAGVDVPASAVCIQMTTCDVNVSLVARADASENANPQHFSSTPASVLISLKRTLLPALTSSSGLRFSGYHMVCL